MINSKYFDKFYTIKPLHFGSDLSRDALIASLNALKFTFEDEYILVCSSQYLDFLTGITNGLVNIKVNFENLDYAWYLVDEKTKTIIYSPGC